MQLKQPHQQVLDEKNGEENTTQECKYVCALSLFLRGNEQKVKEKLI